jgi:prepilin-type N-terminal cleavage/methylation domain-containing protein
VPSSGDRVPSRHSGFGIRRSSCTPCLRASVPSCLPPHAQRTAFTLVETIVVIVILGVVGALVVPRLTGGESRRVRGAAETVAETLGALAARDAMLSQPLALLYDAERNALHAQVLTREENEWRPDRLIPDAPLGSVRLSSVRVGHAELDTQTLRVELTQSQPREAIRVVLTDERGTNPWRAELAPGALRAVVREGDGADAPASEEGIDLDEAGREREPW